MFGRDKNEIDNTTMVKNDAIVTLFLSFLAYDTCIHTYITYIHTIHAIAHYSGYTHNSASKWVYIPISMPLKARKMRADPRITVGGEKPCIHSSLPSTLTLFREKMDNTKGYVPDVNTFGRCRGANWAGSQYEFCTPSLA